MTVQELIDELEKLPDHHKDTPVVVGIPVSIGTRGHMDGQSWETVDGGMLKPEFTVFLLSIDEHGSY